MERTPTLKPLLLLDLDGVLRAFPPMPPEIAEAAFEPSLLRRAVTGQITDEQWRQEVGLGFVATSGEVITEALSSATTRLESDLALLGLAKPDPAIFRRVLDDLGYPTAVFCDDSENAGVTPRRDGPSRFEASPRRDGPSRRVSRPATPRARRDWTACTCRTRRRCGRPWPCAA